MLVVNTVIRWFGDNPDEDSLERVLWIHPTGEYLYVFDINDYQRCLPRPQTLPSRRTSAEIEKALKDGQATLIFHYDNYLSQPDEAFTPKQRTGRDKIWKCIEPIVTAHGGEAVFIASARGPMIDEASKQSGTAKRLIYKNLRRYWYGGQVRNALIPRQDKSGIRKDEEDEKSKKDKSGIRKGHKPKTEKPNAKKRGRPRKRGGPGINITAPIKFLMLTGYTRFYVKAKKTTKLTMAYKDTMRTYFAIGEVVDADGIVLPVLPSQEKLPSFAQFKYHCHQHRNRLKTQQSREGEQYVNVNYGPKLGSAPLMAVGPGSWYFIDPTPADCIVVHRHFRSIELGKPLVFFVKDLFSFMIVGFSVSLEEESWLSTLLAFTTVVEDKVKLCKEYNITISPDEWPCCYLPDNLLGDRGPLESGYASNLVNSLGVDTSNTPPYDPSKKGPIELDFNLLNQIIHKLPGGGPSPQRRGEKDNRGTPCLTLDEFEWVIIQYIRSYNESHILDNYPFDKVMLQDQVDPVPIKLWKWGIKNRSGLLRQMDPEIVYRNLLPRTQVVITPQGIEYKGLYYFSKHAEKNQWYLKASHQTGTKVRKVTIAYDPRTTNYIFLCQRNTVIDECLLTNRGQGYSDMSWLEYDKLKAQQAERNVDLENNKLESQTKLLARVDYKVKPAQAEAEEARKQTGKSKKPTAKDRRTNKILEREERRQEDTQLNADKAKGESVALGTTPVTERLPKDHKHKYVAAPGFGNLVSGDKSTEDKNDSN